MNGERNDLIFDIDASGDVHGISRSLKPGAG
jgi:hypothetical protein